LNPWVRSALQAGEREKLMISFGILVVIVVLVVGFVLYTQP
jgi:t-SNARE complex subunit (syntaxin)